MSRRYAVICRKATGTHVVFSVYNDVDDARRVAERLRELGCVSEVQATRRGSLVAGQTLLQAPRKAGGR
jgi:hypothetical protein